MCAELHPNMKKAKPCESGLKDDVKHEDCAAWCTPHTPLAPRNIIR